MQKTALISIRSFVIYITRISTYHASYYSNTPSHLNNFSCVDVTRMYNMIFSALKGNSFLFIGRGNQFRCALVCCNLLVKKNSPFLIYCYDCRHNVFACRVYHIPNNLVACL